MFHKIDVYKPLEILGPAPKVELIESFFQPTFQSQRGRGVIDPEHTFFPKGILETTDKNAVSYRRKGEFATNKIHDRKFTAPPPVCHNDPHLKCRFACQSVPSLLSSMIALL